MHFFKIKVIFFNNVPFYRQRGDLGQIIDSAKIAPDFKLFNCDNLNLYFKLPMDTSWSSKGQVFLP